MDIVNLQTDTLLFHKTNPPNWKQLSIDSACRVCKLFKEEDVDLVLSANDTFFCFHECTKKVLTPIGVKRVRVALSVHAKNGWNVMITLDMLANIALSPFIKLTGIFGTLLIEEYKDMTKAIVLFTDTHWMTSATNILYFKYLSNFYWGKKVGLVYDKAPSHCSKAVNDYVKC